MTHRNPENYDPATLAELQRQERAFDARVRAFVAEVGESHDSIRASLDRIADADTEHRQDGQDELDRETADRHARYDRALGQGRH